jgi:hypothetical protein
VNNEIGDTVAIKLWPKEPRWYDSAILFIKPSRAIVIVWCAIACVGNGQSGSYAGSIRLIIVVSYSCSQIKERHTRKGLR